MSAAPRLAEQRPGFVAPVYPGDRLHGRIEVLVSRPASRPGRGVVRLAIAAQNRHGRQVQEGVDTLLVRA